MPITLGSNIASLRGQRQLSRTSAELGTVFERLSSGQRTNKASDDAAGLSIADSLNAKSRVFNQGVRNLNDGISLLSIADSAIENLSDIVIRLEELAEQSANGVYTNKQRQAMDEEAQALSKEFFRVSRTTEFNGIGLFDGVLSQVCLQSGYGTDGGIQSTLGGKLGTGTFGTKVAFSVAVFSSSADAISSGDFNGDGALDLVHADGGTATVSVFLGLGDGTFASSVSYSVGTSTTSVSTGDINGDGILDLVAAGGNAVHVLLGVSDGSFAPSVSYSVGTNAFSVSVGDFNGDDAMDIVTADYGSNTASVLLGRGDGTFAQRVSYSTGSTPFSVSTADFNRDGLLDLVTADGGSGTLSVLLGRGDGTFASRVSYSTGAGPISVSTGDFNGDGNVDLVSVAAGMLNIFLGNGDGTFGSRMTFLAGDQPSGVRTGDLNGDGILDMVTANYYFTTSAAVLLGNGDGTFGQATLLDAGDESWAIATGDFNGDGVLDLANGSTIEGLNILLGQTREGINPILPFSLKTMADARQALPVFNRKREQLAAQRGQIGAFQSRIDVARSVLEVSSENFRAAESRIRDADIADESSRLVRLNILQQAASSVLAQANQQPALALQLLRA